MRILLTNDDGIDAPGLRALADTLDHLGEVTVVAPASNQSAVGRGLSYGRMGPDGANDGDLGLGADPDDPFTEMQGGSPRLQPWEESDNPLHQPRAIAV